MRLLPLAKSKQFLVPEKKPILFPGEQQEFERIADKYIAHVQSTNQFLVGLYEKQSDNSEAALKKMAEEEQRHLELMEYNRLENERLAAIREERTKKFMDDRVEKILMTKMKMREDYEAKRQEALNVLAETEEFVKNFLPAEKIMEALESAYDNPVDYNYAIDTTGSMYPGRNTRPQDISPEDRPSILDPNQPKTGPVDTKAVQRRVSAVASSSN